MAVSAIGPGFLTQTTQFTATLASLAAAILLSIAIDIGAQMNTWRILCVSGRRGHELGNDLAPGVGWFVAGVIVLGSFIFNVGNLNWCALGIEVLTGIPLWLGARLPPPWPMCLPAVAHAQKHGPLLALGVAMILLTLYMLFATPPPLGDALMNAVFPEKIDEVTIVSTWAAPSAATSCSLALHRLLDAGVRGPENLPTITVASIQGILITGVMRIVLFLAVLGVAGQLLPAAPSFKRSSSAPATPDASSPV